MSSFDDHDPLSGTFSVPTPAPDGAAPTAEHPPRPDRPSPAAGDPGPTPGDGTIRVTPPGGPVGGEWQGAWPASPPPGSDPALTPGGGTGFPTPAFVPQSAGGSRDVPTGQFPAVPHGAQQGAPQGEAGAPTTSGPTYPPPGTGPDGGAGRYGFGHTDPAMPAGGGAQGGGGYGGQPPRAPGGYSDPYGWSQNPRGPWGSNPQGHWQQPPGYWAPPGHRRRHFGAGAVAAVTAGVFVIAGLAGLGVGRAVWHDSSSNSAAGGLGGQGTGGTTIPMYTGGGNGSGGSSGSGGFGSGNGGSSGSGGSGGFGSNGGSGFGGQGSSGSGGSGSTGGFGSGNGSTGAGAPANTANIAAKVSPGLVDINTELGYQDAEAAGTGIVLNSSGLILTNNHVISGATKISVYDVGNGKTYGASVVGYDRTDDIAVLQAANASKLQTADIGSSATLAVGQAIVGIGNAGGQGGVPSYAGGSITALNQSITASDDSTGTSEQLTGLIQTNADIQPGDSGGALVNANGEVIGVDTAASSGFSFNQQGAEGFAIPINKATAIGGAIRNGKASTTVHIGATPFLGVGLSATSGGSNGSGGSSGSATYGTTVGQVIPGTPAQKVGIAEGDVITSVGGVSVSTGNDLTTAIDEHHPGDKVNVSWKDASGASHTAKVTLAVGPAN